MSIKPVSTTMGVSTPATLAEGKSTSYYRYRGNKPSGEIQPSDLPQNAGASAARRERMAEYTRLRLEDVPKEQAAERVGIRPSTMHYYEREFQYEQQRGGAGA